MKNISTALCVGIAMILSNRFRIKSIDCIYTDIPYLYAKHGSAKSDLGRRMKNKSLELKNIDKGIDFSILDEFTRIMKKVNCFIWCSKLQMLDIMKYFDRLGCRFEILVWVKSNPSPTTNNIWLPDIEYCLYFREKGVVLNDGYDLKHKVYVSSLNKADKYLYKHPTIKPLEFVKKHLLHTTQINNIILDPFSGSGTTCVACSETNRRFLGIEIDKNDHKVSVDRLNGITANGQTSIFTDFGGL